MSEYTTRPLTAGDSSAVQSMTFPAYRHMLALEPTPRHPEQGDRKVVQPVGQVAIHGDAIVGLAFGEVPGPAGGEPELLSLLVAAPHRRSGVATALVAALEADVAARGFSHLTAVYSTGKPDIETIERIFRVRGWTEPAVRSITVRFSIDEALSTPWFGRASFRNPDYQIVSWSDVGTEEKAALMQEQREQGWIPAGLEPWRHDQLGFDTLSSVGLRFQGRLAGWVINHRVSRDTMRFTCSWMRTDLRGLARIVPLYTESLKRLAQTGEYRHCMFITPVAYSGMVEFVRRRCEKWISFVGETKGVQKALAS
ncbi:MAG: GNAT family N-acetyltransferase [Vicinamibacterales bacterium]